jgi:ligand-binding sensor domain-containing protein
VIWLGGTTGLTRFADGRFVTIRAGGGFPVNNLTAIADDDEGTLWIGSGLGIIRIGREECERAAADPTYQVQYHIYDRADGLAGLPFVYSTNRRVTRSMDGRLWFVTGRGLTVLDRAICARRKRHGSCASKDCRERRAQRGREYRCRLEATA